MNAVDQAFYGALSGDATLVGLATNGTVTGQISNGAPGQGTTPNYLWFIEETGNDLYTWSRRAAINLTYHFQAVAQANGTKDDLYAAKEIRDRADTVLTDNLSLSATGYRIGRRRRYSFYSYQELVDGVMTAYAGFRYAIRLFPN